MWKITVFYISIPESFGECTNFENYGCYRAGQGLGVDTHINPIASARLRSYERFSYRCVGNRNGAHLWPTIQLFNVCTSTVAVKSMCITTLWVLLSDMEEPKSELKCQSAIGYGQV